MVVQFQRGAVAVTKEAAITQGLNLPNESYRGHGQGNPPGLFFNWATRDGARTAPEGWARRIGATEGKQPVVLEINVSEENFHVLQDRIWFVEGNDHDN